MRIYFSHSTHDYGTQYESACYDCIKTMYPNSDIVNPKDIIVPDDDKKDLKDRYSRFMEMMRKYYYSAIDTCDVLIAFPRYNTGNITSGVNKEIEYAKMKNKIIRICGDDTYKAISDPIMLVDHDNGFMKSFFRLKKGNRCLVGHRNNFLENQSPTYFEYQKDTCRMLHPGLKNYNPRYFKTFHSYVYAFDNRVLDFMPMKDDEYKQTIIDSIVGVNYIFDLDAPIEFRMGSRRLDFMDYIPEFQEAANKIMRRLTEMGESYITQFSGNGVYIICEGVYDETWVDYLENIINDTERMKIDLDLDNKTKVHIDNKKTIPWNKYFKIPFTRHMSNDRLAIPLPNCFDELDKEWLLNAINGKISLNDILKVTGRRTIW